jgi:predicted SAM-dependent methyltransferase
MKLIIGAGRTSYDGWVSTQEDELNLLSLEGWSQFSEPGSVDALLAEHVWEHLTYEEGINAAKHCYEYLKPQDLMYQY